MPVPPRPHHQGDAPVPRSDGKLADIFSVLIDCTGVCVFTSVVPVTNSSEGPSHSRRVSLGLLRSSNKVL